MVKKKLDLDLNNDGKFDAEDKKLAGKVLATKIPEEKVVEEVKEESVVEGKVAKVDISRTYRAGSKVPNEQIAKWKESGIKYEVWF